MNTITKSGQVIPLVNINGTTCDTLASRSRDGYLAVQSAITELTRMAPHGRDYQLSPTGDYEKAIEQHKTRLHILDQMKTELLEIFHGIVDQRR